MPDTFEGFWRYSAAGIAAAMDAGFTTTPYVAATSDGNPPAGSFRMDGYFGLDVVPTGNINDGTFSIDFEHYAEVLPSAVDAFGVIPTDSVSKQLFGRKIGTLACTCSETLLGTSGGVVPATMFACDTLVWTPATDALGGLADIITEFTGFTHTISSPANDLIGGFAMRDLFGAQWLRPRIHTFGGSLTAANILIRRLTRS